MKYQIDDAYSDYADTWRDCSDDEYDEIIEMAAEYNKTAPDKILELLNAGKTISYAEQLNYYYTHRTKKIREFREPPPPPEMHKCDCGHTVTAASVMSASLGSSCPDCYDDMSG